MITDAMKATGWIEHDGGECPTSDAVRVLMMNYSGGLTEFSPSPVNGMNWNLKNQPGAIIAYRPEPKQ